MKKSISVGEVALIPVGGEEFVPAKVLYISKYYKNVILLALYGKTITGCKMPKDIPVEATMLVYTTQVAIKSERWKSVGVQPLREQEKGQAKRIVGGSVWDEDQEIRIANDDDYTDLPKMLVLGAALVEKKALQIKDK